ncbi:hypothetical protein [Streptomyces sp. NPDC056361]|uniref:hypothetical protein n=1 Tax=Streptomyces sp. NPDC056361 TaxID=3345795 RepID=UPI0035DDB035
MGDSVPVRCPECQRTQAYAAPVFPCACGSPVAPPVTAGAAAEPITHRNWTDEWVTVRCGACGREDDWPHPELGCSCGTVLRVPVRPVTEPAPPPPSGAGYPAPETTPAHPRPAPGPDRTGPSLTAPGASPQHGGAAPGGVGGQGSATPGPSDGPVVPWPETAHDPGDGGRPGSEGAGPGGIAFGHGARGADGGPGDYPAPARPRDADPGSDWFGRGPAARGDGSRADDRQGDGHRGEDQRGEDPRADGKRPDGPHPDGSRGDAARPDGPRPEGPRPEGPRSEGPRSGERDAGRAAAGPGAAAQSAAGVPPRVGAHRSFAERYPAHLPLPPTAPRPAPARGAFRPVTIRTARDAVAAAAGYLRWLGFRDVVQPEERPVSGVDLRAPGLVAQVDPSTRQTGLRAVECLWLNGLSASAVSVFFSLAGYTPEARSRAAEIGLPLFVLDLTGTPQPVNLAADELAAGGA